MSRKQIINTTKKCERWKILEVESKQLLEQLAGMEDGDGEFYA